MSFLRPDFPGQDASIINDDWILKQIMNYKNSVTYNVNKFINFVTPQDFGAKGDGVTDDTESFQNMLDSGNDCLIPLSNDETYIISKTLVINTPRQHIVGMRNNGFSETSVPSSCIKLKYSEISTSYPLFRIESIGVCFDSLSISADAETQNGKCFLFDGSNIEGNVDCCIENCGITNFFYTVDISGRGLLLSNNTIINSTYPIQISYNYDIDSEFQTIETGGRAYRIINNRFHSTGTSVNLISGIIIGMLISENINDIGNGILNVVGKTRLRHSVISNNVCMYTNKIPINFACVECTDVIISGNILHCDQNLKPGANFGIRFEYSVSQSGIILNNIIVSNNIIDGFALDGIIIVSTDSEYISIIGNKFKNISNQENIFRGCVRFSKNSVSKCIICENSKIGGTAPYLVSLFTSTSNTIEISGSVIYNNVSDTSVVSEYTDGGKNTIQN